MDSLHWLVTQRQNGFIPQYTYSRGARDSPYLVKRLANTRVLEGHAGCVNSVSWNDTGTRLISGSDDCHLNIYDTATGLVRHSFHTSHQSNIFSAKFLPETGDYKAVSCAGIGSVEVSEITPYGEYLGHPFKCQTSITYQVATTPGCPHEFLTCEERGMVRMYDLRTCSSCHCDGDCSRAVLCRFPEAVTSMAVHPLEPHYMAVGLGDGTIRLLDRRRADHWQYSGSAKSYFPLLLGASCALVKYRPASLDDQKLKITSVNFNHNGTEILASYSEDYVYLFNCGLYGAGPDIALTPRKITKPRYLSQCERFPGRRQRKTGVQTQPKLKHRSPPNIPDSADTTSGSSSLPTTPVGAPTADRITSKSTPAVKRIRIRGDWSDTGPEARPENQSEPVQGGNLMNRMSRMFARWVDMSLDAVSEGEGEEGAGDSGEEGRERRGFDHEGDSSDTSFQLFSSESDADSLAQSGTEEDAGDDRPQHQVITENESLEGDVSVHVEGAVQEATERLVHSTVQEAMDRAVDNAMDDAMDRAIDDAMDSAMDDAMGRAMDRAMDDTMDNAMDRAMDNAMGRAMDDAMDSAMDNAMDRAMDDAMDMAMDNAMDRAMDDAMDMMMQDMDRTMDRAIDDVVGSVGDRVTREAERTVDGAESSEGCEVKKECKGMGSNSSNVRTDARISTTSSSAEALTDSRTSQSHSLPSSPHNAPSRPLVSDVRENPTPCFSSTSPDSASCDQSCDRSHDHSYRRSRFKVQRNREAGTEEEEEEMGACAEENFRGTGAEQREGEYKGHWEEDEEDVDGRLMRETVRRMQDHLQPFMVYKGHRNSRTMIKQANFFGDGWVMSGSDCGRVFVWDKWTGEVVNMFSADSHVVNCVQPHPSAHMIATSGIDYNIKLWEPVAADEASLSDLSEVMRRNEQMLQESRNTITIPSSFLLRILAYLNRSNRMRQPPDQSPHSDSN